MTVKSYSKSYSLMRLEEVGILWQEDKTGEWYPGFKEDVDLTPYLVKAEMLIANEPS